MSNETLVGIIISVIFGLAGILAVSKKSNINVNQKNKNGDNSISNNSISNEINNDKK